MLPSTVLEMWKSGLGECELWKMVLKELCVALLGKPRRWRRPMPAFEEYKECFNRIGPFKMAVVNAMTDRIRIGSRIELFESRKRADFYDMK